MTDRIQAEAWADFSSRIYELAVACVRLSRENNEDTRQEHGAAMAEVFLSATALAARTEHTLHAIEILRDSFASTYGTVEADLRLMGREMPAPSTSPLPAHERLS